MKKLPQHLQFYFVLSTIGLTAAVGGVITFGKSLLLSLIIGSISALLALYTVWLSVEIPRKTIHTRLTALGIILLIAVPLTNKWALTSPITKTIAPYEMKGGTEWIGNGEPINLKKELKLEPMDEPIKNKIYYLNPSVRHESDSSKISYARLILVIPSVLKPSSVPASAWRKSGENYENSISETESGRYGQVESLRFENPKRDTHKITYKIIGTDDKGKRIEPKDIIVDVTFK